MKHRKKILIIIGVLFLILIGIILFNNFKTPDEIPQTINTQPSTSQPVKVVPLTDEQRQKVEQTILSSDFFYDIPEENPISLRFFYFENSQRVWQDTFYMGHGELLQSAQAGIKLTLHSKYIKEFN